ncbi:hypothetical protein G6F57_010488 [Rhizopus arrhizus]|uniref:Tudor domain-containing protein n=1 Tax=Rhizopus oryzae TaxID=64495 RepID=A0A9P7BNC9_RHIOR|nr:hypothetical protein G6F23_006846 [Rhizopus arrhizus]KAG1412205.1 hypothetical protein G6F58_008139 [Rhizopus delemar]KAG0757319.1 hypothetical protein G6F24_010563 [Rhizopus arrhizus]KAG0783397.1 hypothetical protein G6F21_010559 [Rhizopus arrhizus]KAG0789685.1 hypothetical protein G6F22_006628 [Rhizopus arrhizus]
MSSTEEIESYKFQLEQVELALASDPANEELTKLQNDLKELIAMFEAQLPEQTNSKPSPAKHNKTEAPAATALKTQTFAVDQEVMARWSGDGQFYKANITAIGGADQVFSVRFKGYNETEFVKAEDIKAIPNKKRVGIFENIKDSHSSNASSDENNKKRKAADQPKVSKKKQASEIEHKKNAWLNFAQVGGKKKHSPINKKSIFKSPDNPEGKVGVIGSGKGMTSYQQRGKHIYAAADEK